MAMNRIVTIAIFLVAIVMLLKTPTNYSIVMIERLQDQQEYQHGDTNGTRHSDGSTNKNESAAMATTRKSHIPTFASLPQNVVDEVKSFVFFLGHARSGHSIVGSLLDAHPHIVLGHEVDVFTQLSEKLIAPNRFDILNSIWVCPKNKIRFSSSKGYRLFVDGLYGGTYSEYIEVMGDKTAGATTEMLVYNPKEWMKAFKILKSFIGSVKAIQVIRNPYDNIATGILYTFLKEDEFALAKNSNKAFSVKSNLVQQYTTEYFKRHQTIFSAQQILKFDLLVIHSRDLIKNPRETIVKMCNFLGVTCSDNYLNVCTNKVFINESKTRYLLKWTDSQLNKIQQNIMRYKELDDYTFNS